MTLTEQDRAVHGGASGGRLAKELKTPDAVPGVTAHATVTAASTAITGQFVYKDETMLAMVGFLTDSTLLSIGMFPVETLLSNGCTVE